MEGIMSAMMLIMAMKMKSNTNPMFMAIMMLAVSLAAATVMYKMTLTSWLSFVTILTFSSGMMTLFMYTASLTSNEKTKEKKSKSATIMAMMTVSMMMTESKTKTTKQSMKNFSSQSLMMIMGTILIITLMTISKHGHHPNQTMSTSF